MGDTNKQRQARFHERMLERGYRKLNLWVPARDVERIKRYVDRLTKAFEKERKSDDND